MAFDVVPGVACGCLHDANISIVEMIMKMQTGDLVKTKILSGIFLTLKVFS